MLLRRKTWIPSVALIGLLAVLGVGVVAYQHRHFTGAPSARALTERLYLPDSRKLELASMGFKYLYADLLWLRAIQAFGGRWETGGDMRPIFHYFDVVTDLDPGFVEAYKLGNLVIGDEGGDYQRSLDILRKGMIHNPGNWELPYLGIYNSVWQMRDYDQARWFAFMADRVPGRPEFVSRMREYIERRTGRFDVAYRMNLQYLLRYLDQNNEIESKLTSIRFWDILDRWYRSAIVEAARRFIADTGRDPDSMDELLASKAWHPPRLPTMESLKAAIDHYRNSGQPLHAHYDEIAERAFTDIQGIPPEPNGYTYLILSPSERETTETLKPTRENASTLPIDHFSYVVSQYDLIKTLTDYVQGLAMEIEKFHTQHGRWPKSMEELAGGKFNYRDFLGGDLIYDSKTGDFRSTSLEKPLRQRQPVYIF